MADNKVDISNIGAAPFGLPKFEVSEGASASLLPGQTTKVSAKYAASKSFLRRVSAGQLIKGKPETKAQTVNVTRDPADEARIAELEGQLEALTKERDALKAEADRAGK